MNKTNATTPGIYPQQDRQQDHTSRWPPLLEVKRLHVQKNRKTLLHHVNFELRVGEFVAIVGANGAGKSSLVRAITGEWKASGDIHFLGKALNAWPRKALAQRMAVMSQHTPVDFAFTATEVVQMGRLPHSHLPPSTNIAVTQSVLKELEITSYADRTLSSLSGGEAQKIHFARALTQLSAAKDPTLLILDEPTAALDLAQQKVILDAALKFSQSRHAVLAVLHDLNQVARYADRVIVLCEGKIVCDAPTAQALTEPILSAAYQVKVKIEHTNEGKLLIIT